MKTKKNFLSTYLLKMKQLTKELKNVLTTGYNVDQNEYWINYGYLTYSNKYVCIIMDGNKEICKIKYKKHDGIEEKNIFEWYIKDNCTKNLIRNAWKRYA